MTTNTLLPRLQLTRNDGTTRTYSTSTGKKYPSITTVLSKTKDMTFLNEWKDRVGREEAEKITRRAASRGTKLHALAEAYLLGLDIPSMDFDTKARWNTFKPLVQRITNPLLLEAPLYSDLYRIAGTVDCIASFDGKLSVIDFKTSTKLKQRDWIHDYFIQESFYAVAFEQHYGMKVEQLVTLFVTDDGNTQFFVESPEEWVKPLLMRRKQYAELNIH